MSFLSVLQREELAVVEAYLQRIHFPQEACILKEGDPGDGCYIVDEGEIRLEIHSLEMDSDGVLGYRHGPDLFLGEFSLLDDQPRSASAYAHSEVEARWLAKADFEKLCAQHPQIGLTITTALARGLTDKLRQYVERMSGYIFADEIDAPTNEMVARAAAAQQDFQNWSEERIDALLEDMAETIGSQAELLAEATVGETGMGVAVDKVIKIRFASLEVYHMLAGQPALGLRQINQESQITEFASPVGVVLALIPLTNPVSTIIFKALICLKGRNGLIYSCHRSALQVGNRTGEMIQNVLRRHGAPPDLVQWIRERTSRRKTAMFMKHPDVDFILATGGPSMVRAAYSSGTPAIGVGQGNAPVWICADADLVAAAKLIVESKSFDNGIICGSENNLVVDAAIRRPFIELLKANGPAVLTPDEARRFAAQVFDPESSHLKRELVGQPAADIARSAGIRRDSAIRLLVVPVPLAELSEPCGREKLAPILSLFTVSGQAEGLRVCKQLLHNQGQGHTAIIHTQSQERAQRFGLEIPASRILVNSPGSQGCIGIGNGLTPSLTLGCGTLGGNSTSDNVTYTHLLNVKRLAQAI